MHLLKNMPKVFCMFQTKLGWTDNTQNSAQKMKKKFKIKKGEKPELDKTGKTRHKEK